MKIHRPPNQASSIQGRDSDQKLKRTEGHARIEANDQFERFDGQEGDKGRQQDEGEKDLEALLAAMLENPSLFRATEWPSLVGLDRLSPNLEGALAGVLALVEPEPRD